MQIIKPIRPGYGSSEKIDNRTICRNRKSFFYKIQMNIVPIIGTQALVYPIRARYAHPTRDFIMKATLTGQKRPLDSGIDTEERTSKRFRSSQEGVDIATILSSLDDPHSRDLSPATQEALRVVNTTLQTGNLLLDLSHLSADSIQDLPIGLINPAIRSVQTLLLPPGLEHLPSFCNQLSSLQRLDLPDFAGSSLDLRSMSALQQLNGSARRMFQHIFTNTLADVCFRAPNTKSKIRIYRYEGDRLLQQHALPSHPYFKVLPGNTVPDFTALNGESCFTGTQSKIFCNMIAPEMLHRRLSPSASDWKKIGYFGITDANSLSDTISLDKKNLYETELQGSKSYALVSNEKFGQWLVTQFTQMLAETSSQPSALPASRLIRGMRVCSSNHELHFLMIVKPGPKPEFIAEMYDPNLTRTHCRMVANQLEAIVNPEKPWRLTDFISEAYMEGYMRGSKPAILCFASMEQRTADQTALPELWMSESDLSHPDIMFTLVDMQLTSYIRPYWQQLLSQYSQQKISLAALFGVLDGHSSNTSFPITFSATDLMLSANYASVIDEYVACIAGFAEAYFLASSDVKRALPEDALRKLLQPKQTWSELITKILPRNKAGLHKYFFLAKILLDKRQISGKEVIDLLSAKNSEGHSAIAAALVANDVESVRSLGALLKTLVARGELDATAALELIDNPSKYEATGNQQPVVWSVCAHNSAALTNELGSLLVHLCKKELAGEKPLFSFSTELADTALFTHLTDGSSEDDADYNPFLMDISSDGRESLNANDSLRNSLHTLIFGKEDPEFMPSLLSSDHRQTHILGNIRQLIQSLIDHELLSFFDEANRFMTATDSLFAQEDETPAHSMAQRVTEFHQTPEEDGEPDFWR